MDIGWSGSDLTCGSIPDEAAIKELSIDYDHMKDMIYGEKPSFDAIMKAIVGLEEEINKLK